MQLREPSSLLQCIHSVAFKHVAWIWKWPHAQWVLLPYGMSFNIRPERCQRAKVAAPMRADARKAGRTLHIIDLLIAATAFVQELTVVTRNEKDFAGLEVKVFNPWGKNQE